MLTNEQQKLVETNHNLIYKFAHKENLVIDDYYDILAIGLCRAAMGFDESKGKFSTLAFHCMKNELCMYWRHGQRQSAIPENMILSYGVTIGSSDNDSNGAVETTFLDYFADEHSTYDIVVGNMMSEFLLSILNDKEQSIVKLLCDGFSQADIADKLNCSRQNINHYIKTIAKKWKSYSTTN